MGRLPCSADGKAAAAQLYRDGKIKPFHLERWDLAHRATDFAKWAGATSFYDIEYAHVRVIGGSK